MSVSGTSLVDSTSHNSSGAPGHIESRMRVVGLPGDVVDADVVAQFHPDRVADEAGQKVLAEDVRWAPCRRSPGRSRWNASRRCGRPARGNRGSSRAALAERDLQVRILLDRTRPQQIRRRPARCSFIGCRVIITSIGASGAVIASLPDEPMCTLSTVLVSHRGLPQRIPVLVVEAR